MQKNCEDYIYNLQVLPYIHYGPYEELYWGRLSPLLGSVRELNINIRAFVPALTSKLEA